MGHLFQGKTVLITGASSGFGAAFARTFAKEGAKLILVARRKERLAELEKEIKSHQPTEILPLVLDVCDAHAVKEKLGHLPKGFSTPDILINNAGLVRGMEKVWETTPDDWNQMIDTNVKGILNVTAQIVPLMLKANSGHIINVGSISGHDTYAGAGVYCATKFAVRALTDTLRKELVATPLRVSMISPGMAKTEFSDVRFKGDKEKAASIYNDIDPLLAEDIAEMVLFIASRLPHVNIADIIAYPTNQASPSVIHRRER